MIKFRYRSIEIECSTEGEANGIFQRMLEEEERRRLQNRSMLEAAIAEVVRPAKAAPWTGEVFWKFIESLGETQKRVLSALVTKRSLTDKQLRHFLNLDDNKQLAGVLSGISKQAAANAIPARAVYNIENESTSGEVEKTYVVSPEFLRIANMMNWPDLADDGLLLDLKAK